MVLDIPGYKSPLGQGDVRETSGIGAVPTISDFTKSNHDHSNTTGGGLIPIFKTIAGDAGTNPVADSVTDQLNIIGGEGIDTSGNSGTDTLTISGEDATAANKGIASFDSDDFDIAAGAISLKNKTSYMSIPGNAFTATTSTQLFSRGATGQYTSSTNSTFTIAQVSLPHGAVVTGAVVYGSISDEAWSLERIQLSDATNDADMAGGNINTEDTTITNGTIDNSTYGYFFTTAALESGDDIWGARITYTTDYD